MSPIRFTVLVRTFNSAATLDTVLTALDRNPEDQLLIVDSGSTDGTLEIVRKHRAELLKMEPGSFTYGRSINLGFEHARHDWVLVLSSHCVPAGKDFLAAYRRAVCQFPAQVAAAVGPVLSSDLDWEIRSGITYFQWEDFLDGFGFASGNPNALYRRELWRRKPFIERPKGGEDLDWYVWAVRQGFTLAAVHRAAVRYLSTRSFKAMYWKGRYDYQTARELIRISEPRPITLLAHGLKLLFYGLAGKIPLSAAPRSVVQFWGAFLESRRMRRAGERFDPEVLRGFNINPDEKASGE